jgi:hypothetical protein
MDNAWLLHRHFERITNPLFAYVLSSGASVHDVMCAPDQQR